MGDSRRQEERRSESVGHSVFHLAAQVAVTTSLVTPAHDFEVNARGTLNLLEAIRAQPDPPPLIFTSTNKVYGHLDHVRLRLNGKRYQPVDRNIRRCGVATYGSIARALSRSQIGMLTVTPTLARSFNRCSTSMSRSRATGWSC